MKMQMGNERATFKLIAVLTLCLSGAVYAAPQKNMTPLEAFEFELQHNGKR